MDPPAKTWVHLAVLQVVGEERLAEHIHDGLDFHRSVSDQAAAHLNLLGDNTFRTPWLAAKLLSSDQTLAKAAAGKLVRHLVSTKPDNRTSFEHHLVSTVALWNNLEEFSKAEPACLLWHRAGQYEALFKFLAPRFLLAPDHVLDAERTHARWQWDCETRRGQLLPAMNARLRLRHYQEHNQTFPDDSELEAPLFAEVADRRLALQALDDDVAPGWRHLQASAMPKPIAKSHNKHGAHGKAI